MALLTVIHFPDSRLKIKAEPIDTFDDALRDLVRDMFETMYQQKGVGLAGNQVAVLKRIFVMDVTDNHSQKIVAINPEIISIEGKHAEYEGCLSYPGAYDKVERGAKLRFRAQDVEGKFFEMDADGIMAQCVQHEIDHLNGMLFVDHLSRLKQERARKKIDRYKRLHSNDKK